MDDNSGIIIGSLIGILLWGFIIYQIIAGASKSAKIERQLRIQNKLLGKLLQKNGVDDELINKILNEKS